VDAPDPASPAPSDAPAAPGGQASPEIVLDALLAVVSDLTGYPTEMLSPDMDIEADLGIDSIKRVEILSAMEDRLPQLTLIAPDEMADLKKLGQIATTLAKGYPAGAQDQTVTAAPVAEPSPPPSPTAKPTEARPLIRRKLVTMETPRRSAPPLIVPEQRKIFITTDKAGLSHALADQLAAMGLPTVQISVDILQHREQLPDAAGLILLCDREDGANGAPGAHSKPSLSDAFELIQHLGPSLQASAKEGGAVLATISRMDGTFGVDRWKSQHPYQGGMAGFAKTAAIEWPEVTCRALDIDAAWGDNPAMAKEIVAELFSPMPDGPVEVGWREQRRVTLGLTPAPLDDHSRRPLALDRGDVVVLSGGARGITAAAAQALAQEQSLTLILLGRSPQPFEEPEWLQGIEHEADLKKAIIGHDFAATPPTPQTVHEAYQRYIGNREIQQNLARLAAMGSEARYFSLDIREADKVRAVINDIRLVHGPVKALIHGAGVLRDRLISDKTAHEFDQVFSTKVIGMENLLAAAKDDPLRYIVIFSSVAARFGNIGQVDYAVANEVLNKMAAAEAHERRDCVVRSINWGPWDGGMVTDSLKNAFAARDIPLIPLDQGALAFVSELTADETDPVEVVIGSELPATAPSVKQPASKTAPEPAETSAGVGLSTAYISDLNLERYPILNHHRLDGKPVVPFALMAEWFGHGALHNHPGFQLTGLDDMRLLKGIVLEDRQRPIRILAGASQSNGEGIKVKLELRDGIVAGNEVIHARATAILADRLPSPPRFTIPADLRDATYDRDVAQIYSEILFHGEALQGLRRVRACTAGGMLAALVTAPSPSAWIQKPPRNRWIADPLILDGAFQMASLWCYEETGRVSLPSYSAAYRQYCRRFPSAAIEAVLTVQKVSRHKLIGDFTFLDKDGNVLATMTGFEAVMEDRLIRAFKPERFAAVR
jgi:NAD(P)-dependent dehydrogenase (short-subunit alcohol dehydrogenase family)/acyl carrier protein